MKKAGKKLVSAALAAGIAVSCMTNAFAATAGKFADSSKSADWTSWTQQWADTVSKDYEQISLTPGKSASELNFAWYSKTDKAATPVVRLATKQDMSDAKTFQGSASPAIAGYQSNKATATGLKENSTYYYTYQNNGTESPAQKYVTKSFSSYQFLLMGDPQVGASKGQTDSAGTKLAYAADAQNTAARNDAFSWNTTLNTALKANPNVSFILSVGDQINQNVNGIDPGNEVEYAGFLSPSILKSTPLSTTIGNHDATNKSYSFHFNNPNPFTEETSPTTAGNGYFYTYGNALFVVLNTNNYNTADHEALIRKAVAQNPNTRWRIVVIHQDIYGSGADHSESDGMALRTQLTPIFDKYDVDVVLQGHDHSYARSYLLQSDGKTHAAYTANTNADGSFDWNSVKDKATGAVAPYYPKADDAAAVAANKVFIDQNNCYTLTTGKETAVKNPQGVLYMTANSSTGSKFYELIAAQQDFVAYRNQSWLPSYSVISLDNSKFRIATYSINADGSTAQIDNTFTIEKTVDRTPVPTAANTSSVVSSGTSSGSTSPKTGEAAKTAEMAGVILLGFAMLAVAAFAMRRASQKAGGK